MLSGQRLRRMRWRSCARVFTDGTSHARFSRETICGPRRSVRSSQRTTDPKTLPPETTAELMTNPPGKIEATVGHTVGFRPWSEYGLKHAKADLGWAEDRVTASAAIARWWELVIWRLRAGEPAAR
jgi:hypothetical protein